MWLTQGVVLIARGGVEPDPRIEAVTFSCGFVAPVAVFFGQAAAFALPGSHWLESDAVVLVIALAAIAYGIGVLSRGAHRG